MQYKDKEASMTPIFITNQEVQRLLPMSALIANLKQAYINYTSSPLKSQKSIYKINENSLVINAPGWLPDSPYLTVKINTKSPNNASLGLPFLVGSILLIDQQTGTLLAVMESSLITAMRTGAAGAIGIEYLAKNKPGRFALIGAGMQAEWQIRAIKIIKAIDHVAIFDIEPNNSQKLADILNNELNIPTTIVNSVKEAVELSNIVITTTQSTTPIITSNMIKPSMHINAFGADQRGKVEIEKSVFMAARVFADDVDLNCTDGALNVYYHQDTSIKEIIKSDIGNIIKAEKLNILNDGLTIFANTGLALQDLVACSEIYKNYNIGV